MELQVGLVATVLATLLACLVSADETAMKAIMQCAKDSNIKMETLTKACDADMSGVPGYKCFTKCVQLQMGIMDSDGKFNPEGSAKFVSAEDKGLAIEVATACEKEISGDADLCERASHADDCMRKKNPEIYKKSCVALLAKMMS